jgi:hypothetical protein
MQEDPYLEIEGCECVGLHSQFFGGQGKGFIGCFAQEDDPYANWEFGRRCHVENPEKCRQNIEAQNQGRAAEDQLHGLYASRLKINDVHADFRRGCCFETDPYLTGAEVCPKNDDVPNFLMCIAFFVTNAITLVCPLAFITTGISHSTFRLGFDFGLGLWSLGRWPWPLALFLVLALVFGLLVLALASVFWSWSSLLVFSL